MEQEERQEGEYVTFGISPCRLYVLTAISAKIPTLKISKGLRSAEHPSEPRGRRNKTSVKDRGHKTKDRIIKN